MLFVLYRLSACGQYSQVQMQHCMQARVSADTLVSVVWIYLCVCAQSQMMS